MVMWHTFLGVFSGLRKIILINVWTDRIVLMQYRLCCNIHAILYLSENSAVKELLKLLYICQSCHKNVLSGLRKIIVIDKVNWKPTCHVTARITGLAPFLTSLLRSLLSELQSNLVICWSANQFGVRTKLIVFLLKSPTVYMYLTLNWFMLSFSVWPWWPSTDMQGYADN